MTPFEEFVVPIARPLPVIVLADISGSMVEHGKIQALNGALRDMISSFAALEEGVAEVHLAVITFGGSARIHVPLTVAKHVAWSDLNADGMTPLGGALRLARTVIEDPVQVPKRAYRPTVVLVSDGQPNDDWQEVFTQFVQEGRTSKVDRLAMGIGPDADFSMLNRFSGNGRQAFQAADARQIRQFFRFVSQTVTNRTRSQDPNQIPVSSNYEPFEDDDY